MKQKVYLMLGRTGDIINILPAVQYESKTYNYKPGVIVAREYSFVLQGCSYLQPLIWDGDFRNCNEALIWAKQRLPRDREIINCSVYGRNYNFERKCNSFNREGWRFSQCPVPWGRLPLNFDLRSDEREEELLHDLSLSCYSDLSLNGKPIILTALSGHSSPFTQSKELLGYLQENLKEYHIIDISDYKAVRFYDLLALYEKASCLIATDSAPLHLSTAVASLPVISLIDDSQGTWYRSSWRPHHILRMFYSEVMNNLDQIVDAAKGRYNYRSPGISLVTSYRGSNSRLEFAHQTWTFENDNTGKWAFHHHFVGGENGGLPKVKDMINDLQRSLFINPFLKIIDDDVLMICNSDIAFVPGITGMILEQVQRYDAVYFYRHDFEKFTEPLISEAEVAAGKWYPGSDAFAFKRSWWLKNRDLFPDMYFAREAWDMIMRNLIKRSGGREIHNMIYHEKHPSFWEDTKNRNCRENVYNRDKANKWLMEFGGDWNDWKIKPIYK